MGVYKRVKVPMMSVVLGTLNIPNLKGFVNRKDPFPLSKIKKVEGASILEIPNKHCKDVPQA